MTDSPIEKYRVHKGNYLVEAKYRLSLVEQRILAILISKINPRIQKLQNPYRFSISEYCELANCDEKGMHKKLTKAVRELRERTLIKYDPEMGVEHGFGWITRYESWDNGVYELYIEPNLASDLLAQREFTSYFLETGFKVDSKYSLRLYEIAKQWQAAGGFKKSVALMRDMLGLDEGEYAAYGMFKARCLKKSIEEINAKTELEVSFEERKRGRKVEVLEFFIKSSPVSLNKKRSLQKTKEGEDLATIGDYIEKDIDEKVVDELGVFGIGKLKARELIHSYGVEKVKEIIESVKTSSFPDGTRLSGVIINKLQEKKAIIEAQKKKEDDKKKSDDIFSSHRDWWNENHQELFGEIESTSSVESGAYIQLKGLVAKFIDEDFKEKVLEYLEKKKANVSND
jgi:plasmid replication initiation protein